MIERFKEACLALEPTDDNHNGIDFERMIPMPVSVRESKEIDEHGLPAWYIWRCKNSGTKWCATQSNYLVEDGHHKLFIITALSPPIRVLEKIIEMFPALTIELRTQCEQGNYFYKGTINASGTDLHEDEEAIQKFEDFLSRCEEHHDAGGQRETGWSV
jgi:hypothetical protein